MKSAGALWERIISEENFREAWRTYFLRHRGREETENFARNLDANLSGLRACVADGAWEAGAYRQFRVYEPKPRTISCVGVEDRIVHHALCNVCAPVMERRFIAQSYACRKGKGSHRALLRARELCRVFPYFLKMDVRRYFESVDHAVLMGVIESLFREREVRDLFGRIVSRPVPGAEVGKALPIGNLTSQWLANLYFDGLDHFAAEGLGAGGRYLRYMDDMLVFAEGKAEAWRTHDEIKAWLARERHLEVKDEATVVAPVKEGVPFLGMRIFLGGWRYRRARFVRTRRSAAAKYRDWAEGRIGEGELADAMRSMEGVNRWFGMKNVLYPIERRELGMASGEGAAWASGASRRYRGGGNWNNASSNANFRASNRNGNSSSKRNNNLGFRVSSIREGRHCAVRLAGQAANPIPNARAPREAETNMTREAGASRRVPKVPADIFKQQQKQ